MNPGTFFVSTIQPSNSGSDSLYYGLDVNRAGGNHLYVNYLNVWQSSVVAGALMIRPLLGQDVVPTPVKEVARKEPEWTIYPNPATDKISVRLGDCKDYSCEVLDAQGRVIISTTTAGSQVIDLSKLTSGIYFVRVISDAVVSSPKKIIKL
jgi:hypothetical protein